jgi:hypothetical protein
VAGEIRPFWIEWTRSGRVAVPHSPSESPGLTGFPRPAGGSRPRAPPEYERTTDVAGSAEPIDELAGREDLERELLMGRQRSKSRSPVTIASAPLADAVRAR